MIILLPPIIFESGYNMAKKPFYRNLGSILMYAIVGTFVSIIVTSLITYGCGILGISY